MASKNDETSRREAKENIPPPTEPLAALVDQLSTNSNLVEQRKVVQQLQRHLAPRAGWC